jgi:preprotein translocase subunit SecB
MKLSPLQLLDYFVAEFHFTLNSKFDATKELQNKLDQLEAIPRCDKHADNPLKWTVVLELRYQPAVETNTPYLFSLRLVGVFSVSDEFHKPSVERLVKTNGPSVLYSIARELVREQTARGPDGPFILPTASFVPDPPPATDSDAPAGDGPEATAAKAAPASGSKPRRPRVRKDPAPSP